MWAIFCGGDGVGRCFGKGALEGVVEDIGVLGQSGLVSVDGLAAEVDGYV